MAPSQISFRLGTTEINFHLPGRPRGVIDPTAEGLKKAIKTLMREELEIGQGIRTPTISADEKKSRLKLCKKCWDMLVKRCEACPEAFPALLENLIQLQHCDMLIPLLLDTVKVYSNTFMHPGSQQAAASIGPNMGPGQVQPTQQQLSPSPFQAMTGAPLQLQPEDALHPMGGTLASQNGLQPDLLFHNQGVTGPGGMPGESVHNEVEKFDELVGYPSEEENRIEEQWEQLNGEQAAQEARLVRQLSLSTDNDPLGIRRIRARTYLPDLAPSDDYFAPTELARRIRALLQRSSTSAVVVHAAIGLGPSLLARHVASSLDQHFVQIVVLTTDMGPTVRARLAAAADDFLDTSFWDDTPQVSPGLEAARHALNAGHKLFLVLDASAEDVLDAFDVCHSGQKAKLLLACHELPYHEQQPPSYAHLVKIQPMHYSSLARQMYLRWLTGSRDVVELPEPQDVHEAHLEACGNVPGALKLAAMRARESINMAVPMTLEGTASQDYAGQLDRLWERLPPEEQDMVLTLACFDSGKVVPLTALKLLWDALGGSPTAVDGLLASLGRKGIAEELLPGLLVQLSVPILQSAEACEAAAQHALRLRRWLGASQTTALHVMLTMYGSPATWQAVKEAIPALVHTQAALQSYAAFTATSGGLATLMAAPYLAVSALAQQCLLALAGAPTSYVALARKLAGCLRSEAWEAAPARVLFLALLAAMQTTAFLLLHGEGLPSPEDADLVVGLLPLRAALVTPGILQEDALFCLHALSVKPAVAVHIARDQVIMNELYGICKDISDNERGASWALSALGCICVQAPDALDRLDMQNVLNIFLAHVEPGASGERHTLGALCLLSRERRVAEAILASPKLEQVISFVVSAMDEHPAGACLLLKHLLLEQPLPGADPTLCARIRAAVQKDVTNHIAAVLRAAQQLAQPVAHPCALACLVVLLEYQDIARVPGPMLQAVAAAAAEAVLQEPSADDEAEQHSSLFIFGALAKHRPECLQVAATPQVLQAIGARIPRLEIGLMLSLISRLCEYAMHLVMAEHSIVEFMVDIAIAPGGLKPSLAEEALHLLAAAVGSHAYHQHATACRPHILRLFRAEYTCQSLLHAEHVACVVMGACLHDKDLVAALTRSPGPISLLPRMLEAATQVSEPGSHRRHGQALVGALLNALGGSFLRANLPGPALCSIAPLLRAPHHEAIQAGLQLLLAVVQEAPQAAADALPELEGLLSTVWGLMPRVSDHCAVVLRAVEANPRFQDPLIRTAARTLTQPSPDTLLHRTPLMYLLEQVSVRQFAAAGAVPYAVEAAFHLEEPLKWRFLAYMERLLDETPEAVVAQLTGMLLAGGTKASLGSRLLAKIARKPVIVEALYFDPEFLGTAARRPMHPTVLVNLLWVACAMANYADVANEHFVLPPLSVSSVEDGEESVGSNQPVHTEGDESWLQRRLQRAAALLESLLPAAVQALRQASAHEARDDLLDAATDFLVRFSILGAEAKCAMRDAGAHLTALQCLSLADVTPKQAEALYVLLINQTPHLAMQDLKDLMELFSSTFQRRTSAPARLQSLSLTGLMSTCGDRPQVVAALLEHRPAILAELTSVCRDGPSDEERLCAVKLLLYGQCHDGWRQQLRDSSELPAALRALTCDEDTTQDVRLKAARLLEDLGDAGALQRNCMREAARMHGADLSNLLGLSDEELAHAMDEASSPQDRLPEDEMAKIGRAAVEQLASQLNLLHVARTMRAS